MEMNESEEYVRLYKKDKFEAEMVRFRRKCVLKNVQKYNHNNILEVGCGLEPLFSYGIAFEQMTIIEPAEEFCKNAKQIYESGHYHSVNIIQKELHSAAKELREVDYDFIVVSSLLHEIENVSEFLRDIYSLSRNNSVIHFNVPNVNSFHRVLAKESGIIGDLSEVSVKMKNYDRKRIYTLESLKEELIKHNFKIIDSGSYFIKPFTHDQMQKMLEMGIINQNILEGLDRMIKFVPDFGSEIYVNVSKNG